MYNQSHQRKKFTITDILCILQNDMTVKYPRRLKHNVWPEMTTTATTNNKHIFRKENIELKLH